MYTDRHVQHSNPSLHAHTFCAYVRMYVYICVCIYIYIHKYIYIRTQTVGTQNHVKHNVGMHGYIHVDMRAYEMYTKKKHHVGHTCMQAYIHTHKYMNTHTCVST